MNSQFFGILHVDLFAVPGAQYNFDIWSDCKNIFGKVMSAIEATDANGFYTKINVLAMRGVNDDEILDFVDFSERTGIEVRFLELMRIGSAIENQKSQ